MKCSRCGSLWLPSHAGPESWRVLTHQESDCPLSLCGAYRPIVRGINAAIEAAKVQGREESTRFFAEAFGDKRMNLLGLIEQLSRFLQTTIEAETPMMTEFGITCKERPGVMIRLWASKGQTPVERVAELRRELDAAKIDNRKPEECMDFVEQTKGCLFCNRCANYLPLEMCPCAGWEKERVCMALTEGGQA